MTESKQNRMNWLPAWQIEIISRHPQLYLEPSPETVSSYEQREEVFPANYCSLRYGFECEQGWAGLLEEISSKATSLIRVLRSFGFQDDATIQAIVVKEKLGLLSWNDDNNVLPPFRSLWFGYRAWIRGRSSATCEKSGKYGQLRNFNGWLMTLSDAEYQKVLIRRSKPRGKSGGLTP